jgi:type VI secretion system protein ImpA
LQSLETLSDEKFGKEAPSFSNLRTALDELQDFVKQYHKPAEEVTEEPAETPAEDAAEETAAAGGSAAPAAKKKSVTAEPADRDDAMQRLAIVAHFLRHESPLNPVPYLLLRAMRWGELRAAGATLNPALLEAPPTEKRTLIKKMSMEARLRVSWLRIRACGGRRPLRTEILAR